MNPTDNTYEIHGKHTAAVSSLRRVDEFSRSEIAIALDLLPGELRGYWKYHAPGKWFRQAKTIGKINNEKANLLLDSGAEVSILDTAFARKVGCHIDESQVQECVGIGENSYMAVGRARIKITLAGSLVYFFDVWVGPQAGQDAIIGMDFMVPAGVHLDLADGLICLPDEVRIQLSGRRQLFSVNARLITLDQHLEVPIAGSVEVPLYTRLADHQTLWITRGEHWVPTVAKGPGRSRFLQVTNISDHKLVLHRDTRLGMWLSGDRVPRLPGYVSVGSRRYAEWQNLAFQATTERLIVEPELTEDQLMPAVDRPEYKLPTDILKRSTPKIATVQATEDEKAEENRSEKAQVSDEVEIEVMDSVAVNPGSEPAEDESWEPKRGLRLYVSPEPEAEQICFHAGGDLFVEDVETQIAVLPEVTTTTKEVTIDDIQVGDPEVNSPEEIAQLKEIIWLYRHLLIGKGNALPPATRGAVCDIDVVDARPVAQRVRKVAPQFREKLSDLIKGLLSAKIIQPSRSPWASPIVVIIKKNGVDIRLCIDYRLVNNLTRLMVYPMPLINDLLEDLDKVLWFCSLDMASGFWVVSMTDRARLISAFITPFGLFEWLRMPFGLKNAPQIYQRLLDNALYGFLRLTMSYSKPRLIDLFEEGEPEPDLKQSVLGRRSYIDDILVTAGSWTALCEKVENLLMACDESVDQRDQIFWGYHKVDYLGHRVSVDGLEAHPKDLDSLVNLSFPRNLRSMQSFLGSLNYYSRFIEDFAIYASILYELREADFHEIDRKQHAENGNDRLPVEENRWTRAQVAFTMLKDKILTAPILQHFDPDRTPVVVVYASKWAISAALMQEHDGVYKPVTFTSQTLKPNELNYGIVDKEVLVLLRILNVCFTLLVTRSVRVLTRHSTLAWLVNSSGFQGRLGRWAALLSPWTLEIVKCSKGEDEILGVIAASITPREEVDMILTLIAPRKQPREVISMTPPTVEPDEELLVVSFDGSAHVKRVGGAYSAIVWKLPGWSIITAASEYMSDLTVNEAEYRGLLLCFDLLSTMDKGRLVICEDSNLVIRQMKGEIECKAPGLILLRQKAMECLRSWPKHDFLHMKRDWNQSADRLASAALQRGEGTVVTSEADRQDLITLNRLDELLLPKDESTVVRVSAITRSQSRIRTQPEVLQEEIVQRMSGERILQAQGEERWIVNLASYLRGDLSIIAPEDARSCSKIASDYELDEIGLLFYCPATRRADKDRDRIAKLVIPETLQQDFLHHYHASLEGGHQGIGRTYQRIRSHFHWRGLYRSVQRYVGEYVDCETGKGRPLMQGESPGNVQATYPFQIIAMDHIPSLPRSHKGNTDC